MKTLNIKRQHTTRYSSEQHHRSYGIQNWLVRKGYCMNKGAKWTLDGEQYKALLHEFVLHDNPAFDFTKMKHGIGSLETYIDNRFNKFCNYCVKKFKQP